MMSTHLSMELVWQCEGFSPQVREQQNGLIKSPPLAARRLRATLVWLFHSSGYEVYQSGWTSWRRVSSIVWTKRNGLTFQRVSWSASMLANVVDFFFRIASFKSSTVLASSMVIENEQVDTSRIQKKSAMVWDGLSWVAIGWQDKTHVHVPDSRPLLSSTTHHPHSCLSALPFQAYSFALILISHWSTF